MAKKGKGARRYARARSRASGIFGQVRPVLVGGGTGAVSHYSTEFIRDNLDFARDNWYGSPGLKFGAALLLTRNPRMRNVGIGLAGAAGHEAAFNWQASEFQAGKRDKSPMPDFRGGFAKTGGATAPATTQGYGGNAAQLPGQAFEDIDEEYVSDSGLVVNPDDDTGLVSTPYDTNDEDDADVDEGSWRNMGGGLGNPPGY